MNSVTKILALALANKNATSWMEGERSREKNRENILGPYLDPRVSHTARCLHQQVGRRMCCAVCVKYKQVKNAGCPTIVVISVVCWKFLQTTPTFLCVFSPKTSHSSDGLFPIFGLVWNVKLIPQNGVCEV